MEDQQPQPLPLRATITCSATGQAQERKKPKLELREMHWKFNVMRSIRAGIGRSLSEALPSHVHRIQLFREFSREDTNEGPFRLSATPVVSS